MTKRASITRTAALASWCCAAVLVGVTGCSSDDDGGAGGAGGAKAGAGGSASAGKGGSSGGTAGTGGSSSTAGSSGTAGKAGGSSGSGGGAGTAGTGGGTAAKDIVDTAIAAGKFTKLVTAVQKADLEATLRMPGPFTVFAPTDDAFAKLPAGALDELLKPANKNTLQGILTYHVVAGKVLAADVVKLTKAKTVQGSDVTITVMGNTVKINNALVTMTDVLASNGVIHVIDTVLMPPAAPAAKDIVDTAIAAGFTKLVTAVQKADLEATLRMPGPYTVFAPTDAAFAKLPAGTLDELLKPENKKTLQGILTYHVVAGKVLAADVVKLTKAKTVQGSDVTITVSGTTVKVNDALVTMTDIIASNGVIHVIDTVLIPPAAPAAKDIVDTAIAAGNFTKLVTAVQKAGLEPMLRMPGPFTVFAPTDAAFDKLPAGVLDDLLKPENKGDLEAILAYHVVAGKVLAADVVKLTKAKTLEGQDVSISVNGNTVKINDAMVTMTDVVASNGVIHIIDTVLIPPSP